MKQARKATALIVLAILVGALAAPVQAQVAGVTVGVVFENLIDGTTVDCDPPTPAQATGSTTTRIGCDVFAHAEGGQIQNRCQEAVSVSAPPVSSGTARSGCSVTVTGTLIATSTATRVNDGTVVYQCSGGAGVGTATYSPAPNGAGITMTGPVFLTWTNGVLTVNGAMINASNVTAGQITAAGADPCGPDNLAHPFAGEIN